MAQGGLLKIIPVLNALSRPAYINILFHIKHSLRLYQTKSLNNTLSNAMQRLEGLKYEKNQTIFNI